jgi:signal transduction histidine kinase
MREMTNLVILQYCMQILLAIIIFMVLRGFYTSYRNKYFLFWSWSWIAFVVHLFGAMSSLYIVFELGPNHPSRVVFSVISLTAAFLQAIWLLAGSYELGTGRTVNMRKMRIALAVVPVVAVLLVFVFSQDPEAAKLRMVMRVGMKGLVAGVVFLISAFLLYRHLKKGIGIKILFASFFLYGVQQINYFLNYFLDLFKIRYLTDLGYYLGLVDFLLQAVIGLGMIIWVLEQERSRLQKTNEELDSFLYRTSHDLRAPLLAILGIVQLAAHENDKEKQQTYFPMLLDRVRRMDESIMDIMNLKRSTAKELVIEEVDVQKMVTDLHRDLITMNDIKPRLEFTSDGYPVFFTDYELLKTILTNLLANCVKYHRRDIAEPIIKVHCHELMEGLVVTITDNGQGIAPEHLKHIFDMFYRANRHSQGTGLGLYIVKSALNRLQGTIDVESKEGEGTTFMVKLPDLQDLNY